MRRRLAAVSLYLGLGLSLGSLTACEKAGATAAPGAATATAPGGGDPDAGLSPRERLAKKKAARQAADAEAPMVELELRQLSSHHIVLPLTVAGHEEMNFILDTGASTSVISRETQEKLGLRDEDGTPVKGQGANGELSDVRLFSLASASVGGRDYQNLNVAVMDLAHLQDKLDVPIAGILGRNFLQRHDLEVDFAGGKLRLHAVGSIASGEIDVTRMAATEYGSFLGGLIRIEVSVDDGERFPAVLDLGAARSVMNWNAANALGLNTKSKSLKQSPDPLLGADNTPIETKYRTFDAIAVGEASIADPTLYIADLGVFQTLGIADGPAMVFGLDLLVGRSLVIDYQGSRVYLSKGAG
jgi:predicted aspartyl protease